ncbi:ParB N-terminal domain-containing protein [Candidatus Gracilibacteria bacterium]|nr:ParB N-terminal domain-containing protein [Candidatus Gracilibacteria bacterium]
MTHIPTNSNIQYIPVNDLLYDPLNPRLPGKVEGKDEQAVIDWMLRDSTIPELMNSIAQQGYFSGEPLLVVRNSNEKYIVIEGNRRLTAVKLLLDPEKASIKKTAVSTAAKEAQFRPERLPVLIFNRREDILDYLGYRHITGIKQWSSLAKAKYLRQLSETMQGEDVDVQHKRLAKIIGSRSDYVAKLLIGLEVYELIEDSDFMVLKI